MMLSRKQINRYIISIESKKKRLSNKAKSRLIKDYNRYSSIRLKEMMAKLDSALQ